jgi:hypothetical protein
MSASEEAMRARLEAVVRKIRAQAEELKREVDRWKMLSRPKVVPIKVPVRITKKGARFFELLRAGYSEIEAMSIADFEHGPRLATNQMQ